MLSVVFEWLRTAVLLTGYVTGSAAFPQPLTSEEEQKYLKLYDQGDEKAKNVLIEHNLRLVAHIVKKYSDEKNNEDLISIGTIGLIKGINTYSLSKNKKLSSYVARCIENEVLMYLRSTRRQKNEVYMEDCIGTDHDGNNMTLADILPDNSPDIADTVSNDIEAQRLKKILNKFLTPIEHKIICSRYGLMGIRKKTQQEIADEMGISRSYVSRIEKKCIEKLSVALGCKD